MDFILNVEVEKLDDSIYSKVVEQAADQIGEFFEITCAKQLTPWRKDWIVWSCEYEFEATEDYNMLKPNDAETSTPPLRSVK